MTIGTLDARTAGNRPPRNPITRAKISPSIMNVGVITKVKDSCENVCQFIVEAARLFTGRIRSIPAIPPISDMNIDSATKDMTMCLVLNPSALSVAISTDLALTAEYMVFMAPKMAPTAITEATRKPRTLISMVRTSDCFA